MVGVVYYLLVQGRDIPSLAQVRNRPRSAALELLELNSNPCLHTPLKLIWQVFRYINFLA